MAQLLIESMESDWDPERFHDTHREKVEALIEEKRSGHEIVHAGGPEPAGQGRRPDGGAQRQHRGGRRPGFGTKSDQAGPAAKKAATRKRAAPAKKAAKKAPAKAPPGTKTAARRKAS